MKCDYCGKEIKIGRGIMYAKNDGSVYYFCSKKCMVHFIREKSKAEIK